LEFSTLLPGIVAIACEVDAQSKQKTLPPMAADAAKVAVLRLAFVCRHGAYKGGKCVPRNFLACSFAGGACGSAAAGLSRKGIDEALGVFVPG